MDQQSRAYYQFLEDVKASERGIESERLFSQFQERFMELMQTGMAPIYKDITMGLWNSSVSARVRGRFHLCDFEQGYMEDYIPTSPSMDRNMRFMRIAVQLLPDVDMPQIKALQPEMRKSRVQIPGIIDSELIIYVAPEVSEEQKNRLRREGRKALLRGFRSVIGKPGYLTAIVVTPVPEIAFKRIIQLLKNFFLKRLEGFLRGIKIPNQIFPFVMNTFLSITTSNRDNVFEKLEGYSLAIRQIARNFTRLIGHFHNLLKNIYREIGRQNILKTRLQALVRELRSDLEVLLLHNSLKNSELKEPLIVYQLAKVFKGIT